LGKCQVCGRMLCSSEGCAQRCARCRAYICGMHAVRIGEQIFCTRCRGKVLWRRFWGLGVS
jgi:hypothetical protein